MRQCQKAAKSTAQIALNRPSESVCTTQSPCAVAGADEIKITIRSPEMSKDQKEFAVQARAEFNCRVVVESSEPLTWPGNVFIHLVDKKSLAGTYELKPKRISDRVYEFEGMVRAPAAGKYVMMAIHYDFNAKESPVHKSKLPDGKPNPAEMIVDVRRPQ